MGDPFAAFRLIVHRASVGSMGPDGYVYIFVRANELADAQAALVALNKHKEAPKPS